MSDFVGERALTIALPIRSFSGGKERLSSSLSSHQRRSLAHQMCTNLLEAVRPFHVIVVTNDAEVEQWAQQQHVDVVNPDAVGLNVAADAARAWARDHHREQILIVHSDVPRPEALPLVCALEGIAIVPDHQRNGTNVFSLPVHADVEFSYGEGSFQRHLTRASAAAQQTPCKLHIVRHHQLGLDIDTPNDLAHPLAAPATKEFFS
jgi:2-phospho-L-lactate guanylyltransferase